MNQDMYWFLIEAKYRYQKLDEISLTKMNQYRKIVYIPTFLNI